jgi:restriction system protein
MALKLTRLNALLARAAQWVRGKRERVVEDELPSAPVVEPVAAVAPKVRKAKPKVVPKAAPESKAPACPHCKKVMVLKVARTGANAGGNFWGCGDYPKCRGIRAIFAPMKVE